MKGGKAHNEEEPTLEEKLGEAFKQARNSYLHVAEAAKDIGLADSFGSTNKFLSKFKLPPDYRSLWG